MISYSLCNLLTYSHTRFEGLVYDLPFPEDISLVAIHFLEEMYYQKNFR